MRYRHVKSPDPAPEPDGVDQLLPADQETRLFGHHVLPVEEVVRLGEARAEREAFLEARQAERQVLAARKAADALRRRTELEATVLDREAVSLVEQRYGPKAIKPKTAEVAKAAAARASFRPLPKTYVPSVATSWFAGVVLKAFVGSVVLLFGLVVLVGPRQAVPVLEGFARALGGGISALSEGPWQTGHDFKQGYDRGVARANPPQHGHGKR